MGQWHEYESPQRKGDGFNGEVRIWRALASAQLGNARDIVAYLPPSYTGSERRYPVIYMHDGQNLFDDRTSFAGAWKVDHAVEDTSRSGYEAIIVALPNMGRARCDEYSPWRDPKSGGGRGDAYLAWISDTVKPLIDRSFRTQPERESTGIAGSSMGGLISLYGFFHCPTVFGFCGAMSPALWFAGRAIFDYIAAAPHVPGRIYIDCGTREGAHEMADVRRLCGLLKSKGYQTGRELLCVVEAGGAHNEQAWAGRLRRKLHFLLRRGGTNGGISDVTAASADSIRRR